MRLRRVRVANFRRLVEPVEIRDIDPELTVIAGDNEEGKSTLLEAIRTALFDKYKVTGDKARSIMPYGHQVGPEVELDFSIDGSDYALAKRFCHGRSARLRTPQGVLDNDAAEDELERLLGFDRPGKGASQARHQGVWGLLWVQQGEMFQSVTPAEGARRSLQRVLEAEVGDVLGGASGQVLLDRLQAARNEFWTRTGKPTGNYRAAAQQLEALEAELSGVEAALADYDAKVDRLQDLETERETHRRDNTIAVREQKLEEAERKSQEVAALRQDVERSAADVKLARAEVQNREAAWTTRRALMQRAQTLAESVTEIERRHVERRQSYETAHDSLQRARAGLEAAEAASVEAQQRQDKLRDAQERHARRRRLTELDDKLRLAETAERSRYRSTTAAQAIAVDAVGLKRLRERAAQVAQLETRLQVGATAVSLNFSVPVTVSGSAEETTDEGRYLVTGEAHFVVQDVGTVTVRAGGQDLPEVQRELRAARRQLGKALHKAGVVDVAQAEIRLDEKQGHRRQAAADQQLLEAYAPEGIEPLRRQRDELREALTAAPAEGEEDPAAESGLREMLTNAKQGVRLAQETRDKAQRRLEKAKTAAEETSTGLTEVATQLKGEIKARDETAAALERERAGRSDDAVYAAWADAQARLEAAERVSAERTKALDEANPDDVEARLKRHRQALDQARRDVADLERQANDLRIELRTLGQQGLGEAAERLRAKLVTAKQRYAALDREANAVRVAHDALTQAARQARQTFLRPVTDRVRGYLRSLFPHAELVLDEALGLTGIRRREREESFDSLSVGTREQLAVVIRLAFADLLADQGQPVPIILDDALVYADDNRRERMYDIIVRAAQRHQIILLTCHERAYREVGGKLVRLAAELH